MPLFFEGPDKGFGIFVTQLFADFRDRDRCPDQHLLRPADPHRSDRVSHGCAPLSAPEICRDARGAEDIVRGLRRLAVPVLDLVRELYPVAKGQMDITLGMVDESGRLVTDDSYPVFVDWSNGFNKDTAGQAETIYVLKQFLSLAALVGEKDLARYEEALEKMSAYARQTLFDQEKGLFVTTGGEYNLGSQVWMVLAHVMTDEENRQIMQAAVKDLFPVKNIATPYMYHHIVEALFEAGLREEAVPLVNDYWGKMVDLGADTFWEAFDPDRPGYSPYGSPIVNSYCHAWSCTPVYLIKKYLCS